MDNPTPLSWIPYGEPWEDAHPYLRYPFSLFSLSMSMFPPSISFFLQLPELLRRAEYQYLSSPRSPCPLWDTHLWGLQLWLVQPWNRLQHWRRDRRERGTERRGERSISCKIQIKLHQLRRHIPVLLHAHYRGRQGDESRADCAQEEVQRAWDIKMAAQEDKEPQLSDQ